MYVPAYPLPLLEIGSFVQTHLPGVEIQIVSMPVDYGLPLTGAGKSEIYDKFIKDLLEVKPTGMGVSITAIAQAEEAIHLCEVAKQQDPDLFIFLGGYFPTIYAEEIFSRTSAVDLIVLGEGEIPALKIIERLEKGQSPLDESIPNLAWREGAAIHHTNKGTAFDLQKKAPLNLKLLKFPKQYNVLPYAFSRGCPYQCHFCMEGLIRPIRREVPREIIQQDLERLAIQCNSRVLLISDALFLSFHIFPVLRSLGMKTSFETRCDAMDPALISEIADLCGVIAIGLESASCDSLRRMNKVKDRAHCDRYLKNAMAVFKEAARHDIPVAVFMIAGYPGDTEADLEQSLRFAEEMASWGGSGGHVFKIGECRVYPKTRLHTLASSMPHTVFDDEGVFGENIVRQPSESLDFDTVLHYMRRIFRLSKSTPKLERAVSETMPFFRLPVNALRDHMIPEECFSGINRGVLNVQGASLDALRTLVPELKMKYQNGLPDLRKARQLDL
jgi:pyruvate-formate lyase-activating enzyme